MNVDFNITILVGDLVVRSFVLVNDFTGPEIFILSHGTANMQPQQVHDVVDSVMYLVY